MPASASCRFLNFVCVDWNHSSKPHNHHLTIFILLLNQQPVLLFFHFFNISSYNALLTARTATTSSPSSVKRPSNQKLQERNNMILFCMHYVHLPYIHYSFVVCFLCSIQHSILFSIYFSFFLWCKKWWWSCLLN